jgi:hypothetical protein
MVIIRRSVIRHEVETVDCHRDDIKITAFWRKIPPCPGVLKLFCVIESLASLVKSTDPF